MMNKRGTQNKDRRKVETKEKSNKKEDLNEKIKTLFLSNSKSGTHL